MIEIKRFEIYVLIDEDEKCLTIDYNDDVVEFILHGEVLFSLDWTNNLMILAKEMLKELPK